MKSRTLSIASVLGAATIILTMINPATAQAPPASMKFVCGPVNTTQKTTTCELQVPADTIGTELNIRIPNAQIENMGEVLNGTSLPQSAAFLKKENTLEGSEYFMELDMADFNAETFSDEPYALVSFQLILQSVESSLFPMTIPSTLLSGSRLFDREGLLQNQPSYAAQAVQPLPIVITLQGGGTTETTPEEIISSFSFEGGGGGGGGGGGVGIRPSSVTYCFDDPISSMTDAEWIIICEAKRRGIVDGNPRDNGVFFFPNQAINRAEAVKIVTLGVLRSLGKLSDADFEVEQASIDSRSGIDPFIRYADIPYEGDGSAPWYAVFVNVASDEEIVHGYKEDNTYRPGNKINNAESYRVIVESGRVASPDEIGRVLAQAEIQTRRQEWFMKYVETLNDYNISHSSEYGKFTLRKDFLIIVMNLLSAVGL